MRFLWLFVCLLQVACTFSVYKVEPEVKPKVKGEGYGKIAAVTLQATEEGRLEPNTRLGSPTFQDDPQAPWKIIQSTKYDGWITGTPEQVYGVLTFVSLFMIPNINSQTETCHFEVSYCGKPYKSYTTTAKNFHIAWLPLLPITFWFVDDSLESRVGDYKVDCEDAFAYEFFQDLKRNPSDPKTCSLD